MAIQTSATSKLNLGIRIFFSEFVRVSPRHPSQALFFARTLFWQAGAARRRARVAAEGSPFLPSRFSASPIGATCVAGPDTKTA